MTSGRYTAGISNLSTGLADMDRDGFTHDLRGIGLKRGKRWAGECEKTQILTRDERVGRCTSGISNPDISLTDMDRDDFTNHQQIPNLMYTYVQCCTDVTALWQGPPLCRAHHSGYRLHSWLVIHTVLCRHISSVENDTTWIFTVLTSPGTVYSSNRRNKYIFVYNGIHG